MHGPNNYHPDIVNLYDTGVLPNGKLFMIMQFTVGVPLRAVGRRPAGRRSLPCSGRYGAQGGGALMEPGVGVARQPALQLDAWFAGY